ncbi:MAG: hypothetical protein KDC80_10245 [Saprospiraceae bacterium]|nr:hypothetical protein [Saprospiraceae bacterium]
MIRVIYVLTLTMLSLGIGYSQNDSKRETDLNRELKEVMKEVEEALDEIEIAEVDVDRIMDQVRESMPTKTEMNDYREIVRDAVRELKNIDLSELKRTMEEVGRELEDLFQDEHWEKSDEKKIYRQNRKKE